MTAIERYLMTPEEGGAYTDATLAALLAHAEDGKLSWFSCCCFIGIPTADHAIGSVSEHPGSVSHYKKAKTLPNAEEAEYDFIDMATRHEKREAAIIGLVHAEMARREALNEMTLKVTTSESQDAVSASPLTLCFQER